MACFNNNMTSDLHLYPWIVGTTSTKNEIANEEENEYDNVSANEEGQNEPCPPSCC
jgi:hypothetical protein